jgi:hypothetical protein
LKNNRNSTTAIEIFRREYSPVSPKTWGSPIATVATSVTSYEDKYIEGGVLYEYKVHAVGINVSEILYGNYITAIGFRSPTAIVTGNINYKGGNPVKDVIVRATSNGGGGGTLTGLMIPDTSQLYISNISKKITNTATLEAWVKPVTAFTDDAGSAIRLFKLGTNSDLNRLIEVTVNLKASLKILEVRIGGSIYQLKNYYPSGTTNARGDDELIPVTSFNSNFVHHIDHTAQGADCFRVGKTRRVSVFHHNAKAHFHELDGPSVEDLLLEIVPLGLVLEGHFHNTGPCASHGFGDG